MMAGVPMLAGSCIFLTRGTWSEVRNLNLIVKSGRKKELVLASILQGLPLVGMLFQGDTQLSQATEGLSCCWGLRKHGAVCTGGG